MNKEEFAEKLSGENVSWSIPDGKVEVLLGDRELFDIKKESKEKRLNKVEARVKKNMGQFICPKQIKL